MKLTNTILSLCAIVLLAACFMSIFTPMQFDRRQAERETAVKQRLMAIRGAEERYRKDNGTYTGSFAKLVAGRYLPDSLQYIPYSAREPFRLEATTQITKSGRTVPLMECSATYDAYLRGLSASSIAQLNDKANRDGRFPGLKIGDLETDNGNAGNWE